MARNRRSRFVLLGSNHPLHLLDDPSPLLIRTLQARHKKGPQKTDLEMFRFRLHGLDRGQFDDLVYGFFDAVCARVDRERDAMQVDEAGQEAGDVLAECAAYFEGDGAAEGICEGF